MPDDVPFDEAKHPRDLAGRFAHIAAHPSSLSVGDQIRVKRHTTPGVGGLYAARPSDKGGHTATVTHVADGSVHFSDHLGRTGAVPVGEPGDGMRVHKVVPAEPEASKKANDLLDEPTSRPDDELTVVRTGGQPDRGYAIPPPSDPEERARWEAGVAERERQGRGTFVGDDPHPTSPAPHRDVTAGVSGFVPKPGQTHAVCRTGGEELPLSKFPTMGGGRRGTECRAHRDARREALRGGGTPPAPPAPQRAFNPGDTIPKDTVVRVDRQSDTRKPVIMRLREDATVKENGYVRLHGHHVRASRPGELREATSQTAHVDRITHVSAPDPALRPEHETREQRIAASLPKVGETYAQMRTNARGERVRTNRFTVEKITPTQVIVRPSINTSRGERGLMRYTHADWHVARGNGDLVPHVEEPGISVEPGSPDLAGSPYGVEKHQDSPARWRVVAYPEGGTALERRPPVPVEGHTDYRRQSDAISAATDMIAEHRAARKAAGEGIIGAQPVGARVTVTHGGHPLHGQTVEITAKGSATGGAGGGGDVTTSGGKVSRYTRVVPAPERGTQGGELVPADATIEPVVHRDGSSGKYAHGVSVNGVPYALRSPRSSDPELAHTPERARAAAERAAEDLRASLSTPGVTVTRHRDGDQLRISNDRGEERRAGRITNEEAIVPPEPRVAPPPPVERVDVSQVNPGDTVDIVGHDGGGFTHTHRTVRSKRTVRDGVELTWDDGTTSTHSRGAQFPIVSRAQPEQRGLTPPVEGDHRLIVSGYHREEGMHAPSHVRVSSATYATREDAQAFADLYPKSAGMKVTTLSTNDAAGDRVTRYTAGAQATLAPDDVNKGVNETGVRRLQSLLRAADKNGHAVEVPVDSAQNAYHTREQLEAAIEGRAVPPTPRPIGEELVRRAEARAAAVRQARDEHVAEEQRLAEVIRRAGGEGNVGRGVAMDYRIKRNTRPTYEKNVADAERRVAELRRQHGIEPPRDMSPQAVLVRVGEALRDSGNGADASWLDRDELYEALRTQPGGSVMIKPAGGYETNLDRRDVEALLRQRGGTPPDPSDMVREERTPDGYLITDDPQEGVSVSTPFVPGEPPLFPIFGTRAEADAWIAEHRTRTRRGTKDLGITSGPTGGPGVGTFSGGTITAPGFAVIQRDAPPSSPGAEMALRTLRRQHNAVHGDDDARRARIDPLRRVYARGYRRAKGAGRGQAALDRVRQHLAALAGSSSGPDPDLLPETHPGHTARGRGAKGLVELAHARGAFREGLAATEGKSLLTAAQGRAAAPVVELAESPEPFGVTVSDRPGPLVTESKDLRAVVVEPEPPVTETKADAVIGTVATPGQRPRLLYASGTDSDRLSWASAPDVPGDVTLDHKLGGQTLEISDDLVVALVSVTGVVDEVDDLPEPGVYEETLRLRIPKGIWSHDWDVWVSRTEAIEELMPGDARLPATTRLGEPWPAQAGGLLVATRFNTGTQPGREALSNVRFFDEGPLGPQTEWSVGYNVRPGKAYRTRDGVRHIRSWDCFEYGPVLFGAASLSGTLQIAGTKASAMRQERRLHL